MIAFAKAMNFNTGELLETAVGGFVHDIGKMRVPDNILNKPGKHTDEEFKIMRKHVVFSRQILEKLQEYLKMHSISLRFITSELMVRDIQMG